MAWNSVTFDLTENFPSHHSTQTFVNILGEKRRRVINVRDPDLDHGGVRESFGRSFVRSDDFEEESRLILSIQRFQSFDPSGLGVDGEQIPDALRIPHGGGGRSSVADGRGRRRIRRTAAAAEGVDGEGVGNLGVAAGVPIRRTHSKDLKWSRPSLSINFLAIL